MIFPLCVNGCGRERATGAMTMTPERPLKTTKSLDYCSETAVIATGPKYYELLQKDRSDVIRQIGAALGH
jgi:hypothetical protein